MRTDRWDRQYRQRAKRKFRRRHQGREPCCQASCRCLSLISLYVHFCLSAEELTLHATKNTGSQLRTEGVPDAVLGGSGRRRVAVLIGSILRAGGGDLNALLAVDALARRQVLGDQQIFLAASDEDTGVPVGLDDDPGTT